jgi:hypothetical protein
MSGSVMWSFSLEDPVFIACAFFICSMY